MLETLDNVDWSVLKHAYGPADDVPDLLRELTDPACRELALQALYGNVVHQGTRYAATPHVVPFVVELIEAGVARSELLDFLKHLVAGSLSLQRPGLWCDGDTLHRWDGTTCAVADAPADLGYEQTPALLAEIWRRTASALPTWLGLLDDPDVDVRSRTAVLLALLTPAVGVAAALRRRLDVETVGSVRADLTFALARTTEVDASLDDPDPACRFVAACLHPRAPRAADVIVAGLRGVDGFDAVRCRDNDPATSVAAAALAGVPREAVLDAVPALIDALATTSGFAVVPLVRTLFGAGFASPLDGPPNPLQRQILDALVAHPHLWTIGNLWEDFRDAGIPHNRRAVAELLGTTVPDDAGLQAVEQGLTYASMNFAEQAVAHFDRVPDAATFDAHPNAVQAWLTYATALSRVPGREADAARVFGEAATRLHDPVPALNNAAIFLKRAHGRQAQVDALQEMVAAHPDATMLWHTLGIALRHLDRFDDALAATDRALELDNSHRDAWWNRGSVLSLLGRTDEAIDAAERCIAIDATVANGLWDDADFDAVRDVPRFLTVVGRV